MIWTVIFTTIMHADKIVAMQDGRIVEVGKHADLLKNKGLYYHLYKAQFEHALSLPIPEETDHSLAVTSECDPKSKDKKSCCQAA